ncbi:uncharacterized protein LOC126747681 [Anthonomus grandis grandis]|uniref:uncharacterized protein LOC126747681 n=1 Tax=Anthonomus grandis grandis TaxID=2921223 RepID=UPI00216697A1|nr:uncharacterized protein LOC126747681 [Anthonomus grandis grandis]
MDTYSDLESTSSNISDSIQSNLSSLSCYEQEFRDLKALLKPPGGHHNSLSSSDHFERGQLGLQHQQEAVYECQALKVKLQECLADNKVKLGTIEALKAKISLQHVEGQKYLNESKRLQKTVDSLLIKEGQRGKCLGWYRNELEKSRKAYKSVLDLNEVLKGENLSLKVELRECQSNLNIKEIEHLKEITNKLEVPHHTPEEINALRQSLSEKDEHILKLTQENTQMLSQSISLEQHLRQAELHKEIHENILKELQKSHEALKASNRELLNEVEQLKSDILAKEVELNTRNGEQLEVERAVKVLRQQLLVFREKHDEVKHELTNKNKELLKLTQLNAKNYEQKTQTDDEKFETFKQRKEHLLDLDEFQSEVDIRLKFLANKLDRIEKKSDHLKGVLVPKIELSEVLLQVKRREFNEKRKKMDRNYSLLLRKVREHMKGRSSAEKQLKTSQETCSAYKNRIFALEKQVMDLRNDRDVLRRLTKDLKALYQVPSKIPLKPFESPLIGPVKETLQGCIEGLRADILGLRQKVFDKYVSS